MKLKKQQYQLTEMKKNVLLIRSNKTSRKTRNRKTDNVGCAKTGSAKKDKLISNKKSP